MTGRPRRRDGFNALVIADRTRQQVLHLVLPTARRCRGGGSLVVSAISDEDGDAIEILTAPGTDPALVAVETAVIAAKALRQAACSDAGAYYAACAVLAEARARR